MKFYLLLLVLSTIVIADAADTVETELQPPGEVEAVPEADEGISQDEKNDESQKKKQENDDDVEEKTIWKEGYEEEGDVVILTDDNFDGFFETYNKVFVQFYTSWCGHCKGMDKDYSELAVENKKKIGKDSVIAIARVNAEENPELVKRYNVKSFPDLRFFNQDNTFIYTPRARDKDTMTSFLRMRTKFKTNLIENEEDYELILSDNISVLLRLPEGDEEALSNYLAFSASYAKVPFSHVFDFTIVADFDFEEPFGLMLFRKFDEGNLHITSNKMFTIEEMTEFFNKYRTPKVFEFNNEAADIIFENESTSVFLFTDDFESDTVKTFREVADQFQEDFYFSLSKISTGFGSRVAQFVDVASAFDPALRILKLENQTLKKYELEDLTKEGMIKGIQDWKNGKIDEYFKSEHEPDNTDKDVKILVGDSFDKDVIYNDKHVLVLLHAPWNGYSKKFFPIFDEVGKLLKDEPMIELYKMDVTLNEHPSLDIKAFPTTYLYKLNDKENPVLYPGDRSAKILIEFLRESTGLELDVQLEETKEEQDL